MTSTAPHLDQLELADRLRDHVFTLVRAGEMRAALILIRADVHSAAAALAAAAEHARVPAGVTPGDGEAESVEAEGESVQQEDAKNMDLAEKAPVQLSAVG